MRIMVLGEPGDEQDIVQGTFIPIFALLREEFLREEIYCFSNLVF